MNYQLININKSIYDDNEYKFVILKNKLKVLIISNPKTQIASASMVVGVGSLSDDKIHGMAHFLEHMLFMGNKKYPKEDYYFKIIAQAGGSSNAYTADTHTNYYFAVNPNKFLEILDVFGHFFIDPLLKYLPDCISFCSVSARYCCFVISRPPNLLDVDNQL